MRMHMRGTLQDAVITHANHVLASIEVIYTILLTSTCPHRSVSILDEHQHTTR